MPSFPVTPSPTLRCWCDYVTSDTAVPGSLAFADRVTKWRCRGPQKSSRVESKELSQLALYSATQQNIMKAQPSSAGATGHRALPHFSQSPCCAQNSAWTRWGAGNTGQTQSCSAGQLLPASANQQASTDQNTLTLRENLLRLYQGTASEEYTP